MHSSNVFGAQRRWNLRALRINVTRMALMPLRLLTISSFFAEFMYYTPYICYNVSNLGFIRSSFHVKYYDYSLVH